MPHVAYAHDKDAMRTRYAWHVYTDEVTGHGGQRGVAAADE